MGGPGSGRLADLSAKRTTEDCYKLDINWMIREGIFDGSGRRSGVVRWSNKYTGEESSSIGYELNAPARWMRLRYRRVRDVEQVEYKVPLTTTALPWGGVRFWFKCPLADHGHSCGRRVAKLYLPPGGGCYGCRHCHDLTYRSCQESSPPCSLFALVGNNLGVSATQVQKVLVEDIKNRKQRERQETRNTQRRRRRRARNWA